MLLLVGCASTPTPATVDPPDAPRSPDASPEASWALQSTSSPLAPREGLSEARLPLAAGQELVVRVDAFAEATDGFWAGIVEGDRIVSGTRDMLPFYGLSPEDWSALLCEENHVEAEKVEVEGQALLVVTQTCSWGEDARGFLELMRVFRAPSSRVDGLRGLEFVWAGQGALMENLHDMCISGHEGSLVSRGGALTLEFKAVATFQPDPEFGAVEEADCVKPAERSAIRLEP